MKIGILTYHRSHNYGALLQAIATRIVLEHMGHEVYYVDYWPDYHRQMYALFSFKQALRYGIKGAIRYTIGVVTKFRRRKQRFKAFKEFIQQQIEPYCLPYNSEDRYDVIIYGSDQIWRKQVGLSGQFNPIYYGSNLLQADRHISYAASMGTINLTERDIKFLRDKLSKFTKISVREENLSQTLNEIGIPNEVVLDPTLLLSNQEWNKLIPENRLFSKKYVLHYRLQMNAFDEKKIEDFAKVHGYELLTLEGSVGKKKDNVLSTAGPREFLSLVKHADFVFTSSYHGLIFSLIFEKEFYASFVTNVGRAESILTKLNIKDRLIYPLNKFSYNPTLINYKRIHEDICIIKQTSTDFLLKI